MQRKIVVVGGGASGFMGAITAAETFPEAQVILLEKNREVLGKVRISGGGRCNVTNVEPNIKKFSKNYPRGAAFVLNLLKTFDNQSVINWFEQRSVSLKAEKDGRMFPVTDNSETIVNCLVANALKNNVIVKTSSGVKNILKNDQLFQIELLNGETIIADSLLYAAGGSPNITGYSILQNFDLQINNPVPSLFTFNTSQSSITELSGLSVPNALVRIVGEKIENEGALLITHWGFSGPAILKLSAWAARVLFEKKYTFKILIQWNQDFDFNKINSDLDNIKKTNPKKIISSNPLFMIPSRLWQWICEQSGIEKELMWQDISLKKRNKLIENLLNCPFEIQGKSTFKEEFVTCGGVDLSEIDINTMESKKVKGLFFSGEILDIDAITGGFNFQAAWSTGYVAGKNLLKN